MGRGRKPVCDDVSDVVLEVASRSARAKSASFVHPELQLVKPIQDYSNLGRRTRSRFQQNQELLRSRPDIASWR